MRRVGLRREPRGGALRAGAPRRHIAAEADKAAARRGRRVTGRRWMPPGETRVSRAVSFASCR